MKNRPIAFCLLAISALYLLAACGQQAQPSDGPIFTDPAVKLAQLSSPEFTIQFFAEAIAQDARLSRSGVRVNFGFWSRSPNRDNLIRLLNDINSYSSSEVFLGIWDEGTTTATADQYPAYITMNKEYWYERAYPLSDGTVSIEGVHYVDPHPVTTLEADAIWGAYSQRYADMAALIRQATGVTVEVWCFVQGARSNRIFYAYELSELVSLEANGDVYVHFATTYEASWLDLNQWITGTQNAPTPEAP